MIDYKILCGRVSVFSAVIIALSGCGPIENQGSGRGRSLSQDAWGHRAGPRGFNTVIIDAGHGGHDSGAMSNGLSEKDMAMDTARRLEKKLSRHFKVILLRGNDRFVGLDDRVELANRYSSAVMVSLHYNSSRSPSVRGPETYYWRVDSYGLATRIQKNLERVAGGKWSSRGKVRRRLRLTRNPKIPCVLVELGYLSNRVEAQSIKHGAYRDRLASAVASSLIRQKAVGDSGTGPLPGPLYQPLSRPTDPPGS